MIKIIYTVINALKKIFFIGVLLVPVSTFARYDSLDTFSNPTVSSMNISTYIISDTYSPITHYSAGDFNISMMPVYYGIDRVFRDDEYTVTGNELRGAGISINGNYALTDSLNLSSSLSQVAMDGKYRISADYLNIPDYYRMEGPTSVTGIFLGAGYDLVELFTGSSRWSFVLSGGFSLYKYDVAMKGWSNLNNVNPNWFPAADFTVDDTQINAVIIMALSRQFTLLGLRFRIIPYMYVSPPVKKADISVEIKEDTPGGFSWEDLGVANNGDTYVNDIEYRNMFFPGLKITYLTESPLSFTLSINGMLGNLYSIEKLNIYNRLFLQELEMKSVSLMITYNVYSSR